MSTLENYFQAVGALNERMWSQAKPLARAALLRSGFTTVSCAALINNVRGARAVTCVRGCVSGQ